jgi:hypothetical protein
MNGTTMKTEILDHAKKIIASIPVKETHKEKQ